MWRLVLDIWFTVRFNEFDWLIMRVFRRHRAERNPRIIQYFLLL